MREQNQQVEELILWGAWPGEEPLKELLALLDGSDFDGGG